MAHWLMKTEPEDYSWERLVADGEVEWDGVRNYAAALNMKAMKLGEEVFFYRSMVDPAVIGIMTVSQEAWPAPDDPKGKFVRVRLKPLQALNRPVPLAAIKADPRFADMALVRQSRLSVSPVTDEQWRMICEMGDTGG